MATPRPIQVPTLNELSGTDTFDALIIVGQNFESLPSPYAESYAAALKTDARVASQVSVAACETAPGNRVVFAPAGSLDQDYDDVRRFYDAAHKAASTARDSGARAPALLVHDVPQSGLYQNALAVSYFGFCQALYEPFEAREHFGETVEPVEVVGVIGEADANWLQAVEEGRRVARDLCGTQPERMGPPRFAEYLQNAVSGSDLSVSVIDDKMQLEHEYPLLAAVGRASFHIDNQRPTVVRLEYTGGGDTEQTLYLVGKGITYDTGGADLKVGGHMAGMSRDKGGAAGVAGLMKTISLLKPKGIRVVAELALVRNNIGSNAFVADEIIKARSGVRVRIGNTDAEGRLVMGDCLAKLTEEAQSATNPSLYTVATLTGHAALAKGPYTALVPNGAAQSSGLVNKLLEAGELWGDPAELSPSRREDYDFVRGRTKADDVLSSNNGPSATTRRGHQFPMAFLAIVAGLDKHGMNSEKPIPYTHIDIAGSGVEGGDWQHGKPTATPVLAFSGAFLK